MQCAAYYTLVYMSYIFVFGEFCDHCFQRCTLATSATNIGDSLCLNCTLSSECCIYQIRQAFYCWFYHSLVVSRCYICKTELCNHADPLEAKDMYYVVKVSETRSSTFLCAVPANLRGFTSMPTWRFHLDILEPSWQRLCCPTLWAGGTLIVEWITEAKLIMACMITGQ